MQWTATYLFTDHPKQQSCIRSEKPFAEEHWVEAEPDTRGPNHLPHSAAE